MKYIDLSQKIESGMSYFPGDPEPHINPPDDNQSPWRVSELHFGTHTGTHIDAPSHFFPNGRNIDDFEIDRFILPGLVAVALGIQDDQPIHGGLLVASLERMPKGGAIVIRTDWSQYWGTSRYGRHPYLTQEAAQAIVEAGASLVGIDALNVDSTVKETSHAHQILLGNGIMIVENLSNLSQLEPNLKYQFSFLPLRLTGLDGSPIRAVAWSV